jgi:hypothetical protein
MEGYKQQKTDMKSGTLNVRYLCMPGLLEAVATELAKYKLDFVLLEVFILNNLGTEGRVDFISFFVREMICK